MGKPLPITHTRCIDALIIFSTASTSAGVHQSGSLEHQLLVVALTLTEDMSQEVDVVEGRRADLIKSVLPGLAKLAVAPASDPLTRTICVKVSPTLD